MAEDSSQEKTEAPSAKKREDARKKGTVAKSTEVNSVCVLLAAIFLLRLAGPWMLAELENIIKICFAAMSITDMTDQRLMELGRTSILSIVKIVLPFVGAIMIAGVTANIVQIGLLLTHEPIIPKLEKINPLSGFKRMFAMRTVIETIKNLIKLSIIGYIAYITIANEYDILVTLADASIVAIWEFILSCTYDIFLRCALALLIIAVADYAYQRYEHEKKLKMSFQEIKEEHKQMEGSPEVKSRIRALQREMAKRQMMNQVPQASVVVTNPTHLAIALQFEMDKHDAPIVVAKGRDLIAQRIKKIAVEHNIPTWEDKPLAQAMFDKVEIGEPIPQNFFTAVAEILAHIHRLKNKTAA